MRRNHTRRTGLAVLLVVLGMVAAACGGGTSDPNATGGGGGGGGGGGDGDCEGGVAICTVAPDEPDTDPVRGGNVTFGVLAETNSWSPVRGQWAGSGNLISQTFYDRIARFDQNNEPQPYVVESWESNDTFDEWTIHLREGITFHDGTDLDADVLAANLMAAKGSILIGPVFGLLEEAVATDPLTVVARMSGPWSTFPYVLTTQGGSVASMASLDDEVGDNPVGTGPFRFVSWTRDSELVVEANTDYWREGFPLLDRITFRVITDGQRRADAMQTGDLDVMESSESETLARFFEDAQAGDYQFYVADDGDTDENFVMFNLAKAPFNDPILRPVPIQAIDTQLVSDSVYNGVFPPAQGPIAPSSEWYVETDYPEFDQATAKATIDAWEAENGQLSFQANVPPDPAVLRIGQLMKDLAADIGVDVELNTIEQTQLIVAAISGNYEATGFAQIFNVVHPDLMYPFLHSSSIPDDPLSTAPSLNFPRYPNAEIDAALDGARTTDDKDEQYEYYARIQEILAEETPYLWLVHTKVAIIARNDVRALTTWEFPDGTPGKGQVGSNIPLYQVWLDR